MLKKPPFWIAVTLLLLSIRLILDIDSHAVNLLYWDHWDFYTGRFEGHGLWSLFRWQHGPHRQGLGAWLIKLVDDSSDWNTRAQSFVAGFLFIASALLALLLKQRLVGKLSWVDCLIPLLFVKISVSDALYGTVNLAHGPLPVFLILLTGWILTFPKGWKQTTAVLVTVFLATYTGFAFFLGLLLPGLFFYRLIQDRRSKADLFGLIASLGILVSFFYDYRNRPAAACFVFPDNPLRYLQFMASQTGIFFGVESIHPSLVTLGYFILAALLWIFWRSLREREETLMVFLGFSLLFSLNCAVGRSCLGMHTSLTSRYVPYLIPVQFALYLYILKFIKAPWRNRSVTAFALILLLNEFLITPLNHRSDTENFQVRQKWAECYRATENIEACDKQTGIQIYPNPAATQLKKKLDYLKEHHLNLFRKS